ILHLVTFSALLFEDDYLVAFHVLQDLTRNLDSLNSRGANIDRAVVFDEKDVVKADRSASFTFQSGGVDILVFSHFELFSGNVYDCVHMLFKNRTAKVRKSRMN